MAQYTFDTLKDFELAGISLPTGYQRVEWLQATGTQYINTGLMIGANDVEYNFKWREISAEAGTSLCGNKSPWSGSLYHPSAGSIYAAVGNSDGQGNRAIPINSWINANYTAKNGAWSFRTNETTLSGSYSGTVINSNYNFFLFCNSGVQEFSKYSQMPFFDLKVGGVLLRSFVACRRTSDSVAGMYDIANGVFYPNAGTGTFSIGGDVAPITPIAGDTATVTDLGITLTSDGTDWYVTSDITLATLSQATSLFSFAKSNNGVTATVTSTGGVYKYEGDDWQLWYTIYTFDTLKDLEFAGISLPSGYTKLNYIENQGNASTYIDTNYVANGNTKLRALVSINTTGMSSMGYIGTYRYSFGLMGSRLRCCVNTSYYDYLVNTSIGQKRLVEIDNITKSVSLDGVVIGTLATISYPIGGTYWIGRLHNYNDEYFNGKIYYHEFLENGVSVQKMIPCEDGNGNIGMYDVVTETFFANQGTNPFISGGTAPTITPIAGDTATVTSTGDVYKYEGDAWQLWYTIIPPLVFRGMTFEQTDFWQIPEMVFRGFSFEGENILRYYGVKIDVNGETERNYIPCIRKSDGIAGMYDTVNGVFYASVGTTNFTT